MQEIDGVSMIGKYRIESKFNKVVLDIDRLSTGCKTVLNVMYNPDKVFCIKECGENALEALYRLSRGAVYSNYAMIPFDMTRVCAVSGESSREIDDYEILKEWWHHER